MKIDYVTIHVSLRIMSKYLQTFHIMINININMKKCLGDEMFRIEWINS